MSKTKTVHLDDAPLGQPSYAHLESVVDYLLSTGNRLAHNFRWGSNRDGYFCHLALPIDFDGLERNFVFPPTIVFGKARNIIQCEKTGCVIKSRP